MCLGFTWKHKPHFAEKTSVKAYYFLKNGLFPEYLQEMYHKCSATSYLNWQVGLRATVPSRTNIRYQNLES